MRFAGYFRRTERNMAWWQRTKHRRTRGLPVPRSFQELEAAAAGNARKPWWKRLWTKLERAERVCEKRCGRDKLHWHWQQVPGALFGAVGLFVLIVGFLGVIVTGGALIVGTSEETIATFGTCVEIAVGGGVALLFGLFFIAGGSYLAHRHEFDDESAEDPRARIPAYLAALLDAEERDLLGDASELAALKKRTTSLLAAARTVRERVASAAQSDASAAGYLGTLTSAADALVERIAARERELGEHCARVAAFFAECRSTIAGIRGPLEHLALAEELRRLGSETDAVEGEIERAILFSTASLAARIGALRAQIDSAFQETAGALTSATAGATMDAVSVDFAFVEDIVERLRVPDSLDAATAAVSDPSAAIRLFSRAFDE